MTKLIESASSAGLFPAPPVLSFRFKDTTCPLCGGLLKVLKTREKWVFTLHIGKFLAHETLLSCSSCKKVYGSDELNRLVADGCTFGYDVMVYTGIALFLRYRNVEELVDELALRNVFISPSEVTYLGKKFVAYLAISHRKCAHKIKAAMHTNGGYVLHLDSTCGDKDPLLMTGLDSITEIVLGNVKLPSENAEKIIPFLKQLVSIFGPPLAVVHDMGRGILKAVAAVLPGIPDFICHFHFLRDIGKDLLEKEYAIIRKNLKKHGISSKLRHQARCLKKDLDQYPHLVDDLYNQAQNPTAHINFPTIFPVVVFYSLIQWSLNGKEQADGYGFPFDLPHVEFAQRLLSLYSNIEQLANSNGNKIKKEPLSQLLNDLKPLVKDSALSDALEQIHSKIKVFDKLREAMRIAPKASGLGLNCDGMDTSLLTIEKKVKDFRAWLINHYSFSKNKDYRKLIAQLDKYWEKLFADPITIHTSSQIITIQPQRTNNIMERFFRDLKRGYRRKTGNHSMNRTLQAMLSDTPLVKNLQNSTYLDILLDGKPNLETLFSDIDKKRVHNELANQLNSPDRVPAKIKKLIANPTFPLIISNLLH